MHTKRTTLRAMTLLLAAGLALPAVAQDHQKQRDQQTDQRQKDQMQSRAAAGQYVSCDAVRGSSIVNQNGDEIGSVEDMLFDKGDGSVRYVLIKSGDWLGLGGKTVAIEHEALGWDPAEERFTLSMSKEAVQGMPEFSASRWTGEGGATDGLIERLADRFAGAADDPFEASTRTADRQEIRGEVVAVERVALASDRWGGDNRTGADRSRDTDRSRDRDPGQRDRETDRAGDRSTDAMRHQDRGGDRMIVLVVDAEQGERRVALGPAWYVMSQPNAPMRGDTVAVTAYETSGDRNVTHAASTVRVDGETLRLRDSNGRAEWGSTMSADPSARTNGKAVRARFMLLSQLDGKAVDCRRKDGGEVADVIVDRGTGTVRFLSIDPDENFLGIADTTRLIPWDAVIYASDDTIAVDATREMVLASAETPDDVSELSSGGTADRIYRAFELDAPEREARPASQDRPRR